MESVVEGEDIDPAEMSDPSWAMIRRKQLAYKAAEQVAATQALNQRFVNNPRPNKGKRAQKRKPPASPLPESDIKIILRPRGGLALATVSTAALADAIQRQAGVPHNDEDQVRIQSTSNFIVVSTPSETRASMYEKIAALTVKGKQYAINTHITAPANTSIGVIFNIPEDDTPEQILDSICRFNPDLQILDAKRLNTSNIAQILFHGTRVPFWIRYRAATYRCKPFRRKTEACTACWQPGHRQDVCPNVQATPRCPTCGLANAPSDHQCTPKCIVCAGPHQTGTVECPRRYQPRRHPLTYAQAANNKAKVPTKEEDFPPLQNKNPLKNTDRKEDPKKKQQVSCPRMSPSSSPSQPPPLNLPPDPQLELIKELRAIRAEVTALRQENTALKRELNILKQQKNNNPQQHSEPMQVETEINSPHPTSDKKSPSPPPPKRKAISACDSPSAAPQEERLEIIQRTIANQREEYLHLHQTLLANQTALQATLEAMRNELHNFIKVSTIPQNTPLPELDTDDE